MITLQHSALHLSNLQNVTMAVGRTGKGGYFNSPPPAISSGPTATSCLLRMWSQNAAAETNDRARSHYRSTNPSLHTHPQHEKFALEKRH